MSHYYVGIEAIGPIVALDTRQGGPSYFPEEQCGVAGS
jgi:hypothetical protein